MGVLTRIRARRANRAQAALDAAIADPIIDRLVAATEKRLAQVKDYRETLRAPVMEARERVGALIARIPGPIEVGPRAWSQDATVRPLFAKAVDAAKAFSENEGVRAFFQRHPGADCFGMLALQQTDRKVLATVEQGSMQVEVSRTTVSFSEPQIIAPALDEAAVREELVQRALEFLTLRGMEKVGTMRTQKRELEKEHALLQAELRLARKRGAGFGAMGAEGAGGPDVAALERDLARAAEELGKAATQNLLPILVSEILGAFERPGEHLTIEPCTLALDAMNFVVAAAPHAVTPGVAILRLGQRGPFAVVVARFPRAELREREDRLADAAKYL